MTAKNITPETVAPVKPVQVQGTIAPELYTFIDDKRWDLRETMADFVRTAVEDRAKSLGYSAPEQSPEA